MELSIDGSVYDPHHPIGRLLFTTLSMITEFEADLTRLGTWEGLAVAGRLRGLESDLSPAQEGAPGEAGLTGSYLLGVGCAPARWMAR